MDVVDFSGVTADVVVAEIGVGTGNFLSLFADGTRRLVGIDLTHEMVTEARRRRPSLLLVQGDGARLPLRSRTVDLVASAQTFHHIREPVPVLKEMRRVMKDDGALLVVDQAAPERVEEALMMNELDRLRDPSHAACRPPSAFRIMLGAAGLAIEKEAVFDSAERFSRWMSPEEFPQDRIGTVRNFIAEHAAETGMGFVPDGDDWRFTRRRLMLVARRSAS